MKLEEAEQIVEALVFAAPRPIGIRSLADILDVEPGFVETVVEQLHKRYRGRGITLRFVAGGLQFVTASAAAPWIEKLGRPLIHTPLSAAGVETLAIVAYRQPITKAEIEAIRGVRADSAINTLIERDMVMEVGRRDGPGRPILYGTTEEFLIHFGLAGLQDLPPQEKFSPDVPGQELPFAGQERSDT